MQNENNDQNINRWLIDKLLYFSWVHHGFISQFKQVYKKMPIWCFSKSRDAVYASLYKCIN